MSTDSPPNASEQVRFSRYGARLCNAKKNTCGANAIKGKTKCRNHGGMSLSGIASPSFKHGRYVKTLPARLLPRYKEAMKDAELLSLAEDIGLVDTRLGELLTLLDTHESGHLWKQVRDAFEDFSKASAEGDTTKMAGALNELGVFIRRGMGDAASWNEVTGLVEQRRKLSESEQRRRVMAGYMLKVDEAALLVTALLGAIRRHVTDAKVLSAISGEFAMLMGQTAALPAGAMATASEDAA